MNSIIKSVPSVLLIFVGVVIIFGGLGVVNEGRIQVVLADNWVPPESEPCIIPAGAVDYDYRNTSLIDRYHMTEEVRGEYCPDREPPKNPYEGGWSKIGVGLLIALFGSGIVYLGTR